MSAEFWPVTASTMPILALAVVVEARTIPARWWDEDMPTVSKVLQCLSWAYALGMSSLVEIVSFSILSGGSRGTGVWASLARNAVSADVGVLLFVPLLILCVQVLARPIAWGVIAAHPKVLRINRNRRKMLRRLARNERKLAKVTAALDSLATRGVDARHPDCNECMQLQHAIQDARQNVAATVAQGRAIRSDIEASDVELRVGLKAFREDLSNALLLGDTERLEVQEPPTAKERAPQGQVDPQRDE